MGPAGLHVARSGARVGPGGAYVVLNGFRLGPRGATCRQSQINQAFWLPTAAPAKNFRVALGATWGPPGSTWRALGPAWDPVGPTWCSLDSAWDPVGPLAVRAK